MDHPPAPVPTPIISSRRSWEARMLSWKVKKE
jgi:hypothetical protein